MAEGLTSFRDFLHWERMSRDTIEVKRAYIDMAGDLAAGVMLSQIVYWHLPNDEGKSRLKVEWNGHLWLAKSYNDWWVECRLKADPARRALDILVKKGLVEVIRKKFDGAPTMHIRIDEDNFLAALNRCGENPISNWAKPPIHLGRKPARNGTSPTSLTETTAEIPAKTTASTCRPSPQGAKTASAAVAALVEALVSAGVNRCDAERLAGEKPDTCRRQLDYLRYREPPRSPGGYLRRAIEGDYAAPSGYVDQEKRKAAMAELQQRQRQQQTRQDHEARFAADHLAYLRQRKQDLINSGSSAYQQFQAEEAHERARRSDLFKVSPKIRQQQLELWDNEQAYYKRLVQFFQKHAPGVVLGFWDWDSQHNPQRLVSHDPESVGSILGTVSQRGQR